MSENSKNKRLTIGLIIFLIICLIFGLYFIYQMTYSNNKESNNNEVTKDTNVSSKDDNKELKDAGEAYKKLINENNEFNDDYRYSLLFFNNDEIPDLLITKVGINFLLYVYKDGNAKQLVDNYMYGVHESGFYYAPKLSLFYTKAISKGDYSNYYYDLSDEELEQHTEDYAINHLSNGEITTNGELNFELPEDDKFVDSQMELLTKDELLEKINNM